MAIIDTRPLDPPYHKCECGDTGLVYCKRGDKSCAPCIDEHNGTAPCDDDERLPCPECGDIPKLGGAK